MILLKKKLILYYLLESVGSFRVERRDAQSDDLGGCRVNAKVLDYFLDIFRISRKGRRQRNNR